MTEENTTKINEETGVTEGVAEPIVDEQAVNWRQAQETMAQQKREIEDLRRGTQTYAEQVAVLKNYMDNQNISKSQQKSYLDSIDASDFVTGADLQKSIVEREKNYQNTISSLENKMKILEMKAKDPTYDELARETIKMAENDPELAKAIQTSANPQYLAYALGKARKDAVKPPVNKEIESLLKSSEKPGNAARAPGAGSAVSRADFFSTMSKSEFEAHIAGVKSSL